MIRELCRDDKFLSLKAQQATREDIQVGIDLMDTLRLHKSTCVGMAANMIGINKAIIAILDRDKYVLMYNPKILRYYGNKYVASEGCLCHSRQKQVERFDKIQVEYENGDFKKVVKSFSGFTSEIIQHEIDHLNGILI